MKKSLLLSQPTSRVEGFAAAHGNTKVSAWVIGTVCSPVKATKQRVVLDMGFRATSRAQGNDADAGYDEGMRHCRRTHGN